MWKWHEHHHSREIPGTKVVNWRNRIETDLGEVLHRPVVFRDVGKVRFLVDQTHRDAYSIATRVFLLARQTLKKHLGLQFKRIFAEKSWIAASFK